MRNIKKFATDNGYGYSMTTNDWGERKVRLTINGIDWIIEDRESDVYYSIHGWRGNSDKYSVRRVDDNYGNSITEMTQKNIIEHIKDIEKSANDNKSNNKEDTLMELEKPKTDVEVELIGEDGNIFNLAGKVSKALKRNGHRDLAKELQEKLFKQKSYDDALRLLTEYVKVS